MLCSNKLTQFHFFFPALWNILLGIYRLYPTKEFLEKGGKGKREKAKGKERERDRGKE